MHTRQAGVLSCAIALAACVAAAEDSQPMRLGDLRPRWVAVEFEISPLDRPTERAVRYTRKLPAWLEPDLVSGAIRVTTPGWAIEQNLMAREHPVPGSFSDFVWRFEASSGRVLEARFSGAVVRELDFGLFRQVVVTQLEVSMTSDRLAGFRAPVRVLGQQLYGYCIEREPRCTIVAGRPYDPDTGLVNAVGGIAAYAAGVKAESFSPLGEARFSEVEASPHVQTSMAEAR